MALAAINSTSSRIADGELDALRRASSGDRSGVALCKSTLALTYIRREEMRE